MSSLFRRATLFFKGSPLLLVSIFCISQVRAQVVCPPPDACGACEGGMVSITLQFMGSFKSEVKIEDNKIVIFTGLVDPDGLILIEPIRDAFKGNTLDVYVDGTLNTTLNTKCNIPVYLNTAYGDFVVVGGASRDGGPICCVPKPDKPTDPGGELPEEYPFVISKVVTPNGDGTNDVWVLLNVEIFSATEVTIVDRWGGIVFEGKGYDNRTVAWGGEVQRGGYAPTGTYFFNFRGVFGEATVERHGYIELIR